MTETTNNAPETIVIAPQPKTKRSHRGWIAGGAIAIAGLAAFGAVQAISQPFGGHGFAPGHHGFGGHGIGMHAAFDPARMEQRVEFGADIILGRVGANDEQKKKVTDLIKANLKEMPALREQHVAARNKVIELLKADKLDKAELEKVRATQLALADQISMRLVQSVADASEVLTAKQRQELILLWEKRPGWR